MTENSDPIVEERLRQLHGLVEADPQDALSRFLLGRELIGAGRFEEARHSFAEAIRLQPDYTAAYRQLGNCHEKLEQFSEAASAYARGVAVAGETGDLQAGKEMQAFLRRLERDRGIRPD